MQIGITTPPVFTFSKLNHLDDDPRFTPSLSLIHNTKPLRPGRLHAMLDESLQ